MAATMVELKEVEKHLITTMGYPNVTDVKLIYERSLIASDVNANQLQLAMPDSKVLTRFLHNCEDFFLQLAYANRRHTKIPLNVVVKSTEYQLTLSRWNNNDGNGWKYVLIGGWNRLMVENRLQSGDPIRVVSFRPHNDNIGFVLLHEPAN